VQWGWVQRGWMQVWLAGRRLSRQADRVVRQDASGCTAAGRDAGEWSRLAA
jgi:hypothetical protein